MNSCQVRSLHSPLPVDILMEGRKLFFISVSSETLFGLEACQKAIWRTVRNELRVSSGEEKRELRVVSRREHFTRENGGEDIKWTAGGNQAVHSYFKGVEFPQLQALYQLLDFLKYTVRQHTPHRNRTTSMRAQSPMKVQHELRWSKNTIHHVKVSGSQVDLFKSSECSLEIYCWGEIHSV